MLSTKVKETSRKNMFTTVVEEDGKIEWDARDGKKREKILQVVGMEYKQINLLAAVLAEIVKADTALQDNPIIANAMAKFAEIDAIRNS